MKIKLVGGSWDGRTVSMPEHMSGGPLLRIAQHCTAVGAYSSSAPAQEAVENYFIDRTTNSGRWEGISHLEFYRMLTDGYRPKPENSIQDAAEEYAKLTRAMFPGIEMRESDLVKMAAHYLERMRK